jgi:hypothetical protein
MQTAFCFFDSQISTPKIIKEKSLKLQPRDLEILGFILEMKFATLENIHAKFFSTTRFGQSSTSTDYARQRIAILISEGLLDIKTSYDNTGLYLTTRKGYYTLKNFKQTEELCRPITDIDIRTLAHDQRVTQTRIALENSGLANNWISERRLSETEEVKKYLSSEFRPDAIYMNSTGEKVAFELEIARKSKERYRQKIKRYIEVMTTGEATQRIFNKVHYVCEKENILELIKYETQLYQSLFQFSLESEILKSKTNSLGTIKRELL